MKRILLAISFIAALSACGTSPGASNQSAQAAAPSAPATAFPTIAPSEIAVLEQPTQAPTVPPAVAISMPEPTVAPVVKHSVTRIVIGDINLDETTVPVGLDENRVPIVPKHEVGWYTSSAGPGENENIVLWGHVLRFKATPNIPAPFQRVKELRPGAQITVYDEANVPRVYAVTEQVQVKPEEVTYIMPTGSEQITLVSCIGDKVQTEAGVEMTRRLITIAKPVD